MAAGDIENSRVGSWVEQIISKLNPGQGVNFVVSGPISSSLKEEGTSFVDPQQPQSELHLVGLGLRKDTGYQDALLNCAEVWIPFKDETGTHRVVLKVEARTSYPNWVYLWTLHTDENNLVSRSWMPVAFSEENAFTEYNQGQFSDFDYSCSLEGPGGILFIPYIHSNYLTTDDYNAVLGNAIDVAETPGLYSVLRNEVDEGLQKFVSPDLRYKNYIEDNHKDSSVGGTHTGEFSLPGGDLSRVLKQHLYLESFKNRAKEVEPDATMSLQTLDLPYMSYRAISASVYVDRYNSLSSSTDPVSLEKVWEDLQGGNTDNPETVYFANRAFIVSKSAEFVQFEQRTSVPVVGSILFKMDGHTAVRFTKATVYAPFLNTVYRTGEYGEVKDLYPTESIEAAP